AIEERRLAGAVGADEADDGARSHIEAHAIQRRVATEPDRDLAHLDERGHACSMSTMAAGDGTCPSPSRRGYRPSGYATAMPAKRGQRPVVTDLVSHSTVSRPTQARRRAPGQAQAACRVRPRVYDRRKIG